MAEPPDDPAGPDEKPRELAQAEQEPDEEEVVLPIERHLDLHAFRPRDIASVVESYLEAAVAAGFCEVRLIHGRGIGVQREIVRAVLGRNPAVRDFEDAPPERGGWGATLARLEPAATEPGPGDD